MGHGPGQLDLAAELTALRQARASRVAARQAWLRQQHAQRGAARDAGLAARHRSKLARLTQEDQDVTVYIGPAGERQVQPADLDRRQAQRLRRAARRSARTPKPSTVDEQPKDAA